jgi:Ni,Fe-hydrogenase III small subunit/ferredoxin
MFSALKVRQSQGRQYIVDLRAAVPRNFRGRPEVDATACEAGCVACQAACPTQAITLNPVRIDLGRCVFCEDCAVACPVGKMHFTPDTHMGSTTPEGLVVTEGQKAPSPLAVSEALRSMFGHSLKLRSVSTGGCNGCELELNAAGNVNFDMGRYGIEFVASPRHADALVLSGPLTRNMNDALELCYAGMPDPKFVIAFGACAISGGPFRDSPSLERGFVSRFKPALYVPGCPPHPLTFVNALMDLLGIKLPR